MSLVTCCPACGTLFRVVPDQLKVADGWVRCGRCGDVFDAQGSLQDEQDVPVAQATHAPREREAQVHADANARNDPLPSTSGLLVRESQPMPLEPGPAFLPEPAAAEESVVPDAADEAQAEQAEQAVQAVQVAQAVLLPAANEPHADLAVTQLHVPATPEDVLVEPLAAAVMPSHDAAAPAAAEAPAGTQPQAPAPAPACEEVSFVRRARRRAFWKQPAVRAAQAAVAIVLGLLLALQVAFHERDALVARTPALRPVFDAVCAPLRCRVGPPRRIEDIVIDSSKFARLRSDAYRLSLTLHNQGDLALQMPALELTLTDTSDRTVIRRVLLPADYAAGEATLAAQSEWSAAVTLGISSDAAAARVAGYRLLAFYP